MQKNTFKNDELVEFTITIYLPKQDVDVINEAGAVHGYAYATAMRWAMAHACAQRQWAGEATVGMVKQAYDLWKPFVMGMLSEYQLINPKYKTVNEKWLPKLLENGKNRLDWIGEKLGFDLPPINKRGAKVAKTTEDEEVLTID